MDAYDIEESIKRLEQEHRTLDEEIDTMISSKLTDIMQIQRLKKRKLQIKDEITKLRSMQYPDIIA